MAMHLVPPGTRPANPFPMHNTNPPRRELIRVRDQVQRMSYPDEDNEPAGWPEHMIDQRYIPTQRSHVVDDEEDGDGF